MQVAFTNGCIACMNAEASFLTAAVEGREGRLLCVGRQPNVPRCVERGSPPGASNLFIVSQLIIVILIVCSRCSRVG